MKARKMTLRFLGGCRLGFGIMLTLLLFSASARAACLKSTREAQFPDGSAKLEAYACSVSDGQNPVLKIDIDDLSEVATGSMLEGAEFLELAKLYGKLIILHNNAFAEVKHLFDTYGIKDTTTSCLVFDLRSPGGCYETKFKSYDPSCTKKHTLWYLTYPEVGHLGEIPLPAFLEPHIRDKRWPTGWHFFYSDCKDADLLSCTVMWRPVQKNDLKAFSNGIAEEELQIGAPLSVGDDRDRRVYDRYIALVSHLSAGNLPDDFLIAVYRGPGGCECGPVERGSIYIRRMILRVAFVTNISRNTITIDSLTGLIDEDVDLRPYDDNQERSRQNREQLINIALEPEKH